MSEEILVRQGAPTLAGIKTGSLFPCPCEDREALLSDIRKLNRRLSPKGLCLLPLRFLPGQALLYLYRPAGLRRDLRDVQASELLQQAGAMLYVVVEELIPEMSQGKHSDIGTVFFAVGFSVMMVLDVALG